MFVLLHQHTGISQVGINHRGSLRSLLVLHCFLVIFGGLRIVPKLVEQLAEQVVGMCLVVVSVSGHQLFGFLHISHGLGMLLVEEIHVGTLNGTRISQEIVLQLATQFVTFEGIFQSSGIALQIISIRKLAEQKPILSVEVLLLRQLNTFIYPTDGLVIVGIDVGCIFAQSTVQRA